MENHNTGGRTADSVPGQTSNQAVVCVVGACSIGCIELNKTKQDYLLLARVLVVTRMSCQCTPLKKKKMIRRHMLRRPTSILLGGGVVVVVVMVVVTLSTMEMGVEAVLQHYAMDIVVTTTSPTTKISTMLLSHAYFGATFPMTKPLVSHRRNTPELPPPLTLSYPPDETNALLCRNMTSSSSYPKPPKPFVLLVPRGECTFETKAYHAQLFGASAVIIYGTLASRYTYNTTNSTSNSENNKDDTFWNSHLMYPKSKYDYDCQYGQAWIPIAQSGLVLNPTYNPYINDPLLTSSNNHDGTDTNLCRRYDSASATTTTLQSVTGRPTSHPFQTHCVSQQCLLTGNVGEPNTDKTNHSMMEACCAWDLPIWLYPDTSATTTIVPQNDSVHIPVAYMTTQQMYDLQQIILQNTVDWNPTTTTSTTIGVILYQRWRPTYNYSAICIWLLGCLVATIAAYSSAQEYHTAIQYYYNKRLLRQQQQQQSSSRGTNATPETTTTTTATTNPSTPRHAPPPPEEVLELTAMHAVGFVVMASTSLMVLFYFKIYSIVKIMYAVGCSTAVSQVIFVPLYDATVSRYYRNIIVWRTNTEDFGDITVKDIVTHICGFSCGISWLLISFLFRHADEITYYWVMQDVFGACMCITFLKVIRLNSIRVASILLIVAFFYDIFFVFITPHLFHGKSVMITVATSGGPPKADALWCEKYPSDKDCQGGNPLPMLLAIPKLFDYIGGSSLLGLGDIVLPGLLLSFAARFDAAKVLVGVLGGGRPSNQSYNCPEQQCCNNMLPSRCGTILCSGGYFAPLIVAYAIGLAMANTAVYVMHMGQPALLYLVPCCLGTMIYIGYRRNELSQLWDGPRVLQSADNILYNNNGSSNRAVNGEDGSGPESQPIASSSSNVNQNQSNLHAPIPMDDEEGYGNDALAVAPPSAVDDDDDN